ncbi:MAG: DUF2203 domain-containing protein [Acidobacteriota bacterium]
MSEEQEAIRTFTLREARSLIPKLRTLFARLNKEREVLVKMNDELQRAREKAEANGGTPQGVAYLTHLTAFSTMVHKVQSLGVLIKDFHTGLIDFPYEYEGRIVYLCWKTDEDDIDWWHEIEAGFAGRQLLTEDFE